MPTCSQIPQCFQTAPNCPCAKEGLEKPRKGGCQVGPWGGAHPLHTSTIICRPCGVMFRCRRLVSKSSRACMVSRYRDWKMKRRRHR